MDVKQQADAVHESLHGGADEALENGRLRGEVYIECALPQVRALGDRRIIEALKESGSVKVKRVAVGPKANAGGPERPAGARGKDGEDY